jgi:hypothetical protein
VAEIRLSDPSGIRSDLILSQAATASIISFANGTSNRLKFTVNPSLCGVECDFNKATEFEITFRLSADDLFRPFNEVFASKTF